MNWHIVMFFFWIFLWITLGSITVYSIGTILNGWISTKAAPRVDMFFCDVHGPIPRDGVIRFLDTDTCGICFHNKMKKAERGQI